MRAPLRVGVVGFGTAGQRFHAPYLLAHPELELAAVVTRDAGRAADARNLVPGVRVLAAFGELLDGSVDVVVVASPSGVHAAQARAAITAGVATVVDKPLAPTAAEATELVELAVARGVPLTVYQNRRFDDDVTLLRKVLADGRLGTVRRFESRFEWWKPQSRVSWKSQSTPAQGGGLLLDLGTHLVDQAVQLFGPVASVESAQLESWRPDAAAEDDAFAALRHNSGVLTHLWMNGMAAVRGPRFRVLGSEGGFVSHGLDPQESLPVAGGMPTDPDFDAGGRTAVVSDGEQETMVAMPRASYLRFYEGVADWLLRGGPAPVDPADAVQVLRVLDEVRAAAHASRMAAEQK